MYRPYSVEELKVLSFFIQTYGHLTYFSSSSLEAEFFKRTGIHRASGALYMAAWRLERGYYDHLFTA